MLEILISFRAPAAGAQMCPSRGFRTLFLPNIVAQPTGNPEISLDIMIAL